MTDTKQVERLIEINDSYTEAVHLVYILRNPSKGMHAQVVESEINKGCWNVRLVINP